MTKERVLKKFVISSDWTIDAPIKPGDVITIAGEFEDRWFDPVLRWASRKWWHLRCLFWDA